MTPWTKKHDIDLIVAYLGYEIQTCGKLTVCIDGNGQTHKIPDMRDRTHGWLLDCLDSWLRVRKNCRYAWLESNYASMIDCETAMRRRSGEGDNMHDALAWALWKAR